jgi:hypothetical protein
VISPGVPFSSTLVDDEKRRPLIISLQISPKPICCSTSSKNGQETESNAFAGGGEKNPGLLLLVEEPSRLLHKHEVVLDKSTFDECTLYRGNQPMHLSCQPISKQLGNKFSKAMYQDYRPKVLYLNSSCLFWN